MDVSSTNYNGLAASSDVVGGTSYDGGTITRGSTVVYDMNLQTSADGNLPSDTAEDTISVHETSGFHIFINAGGGKIKTRTGNGTWTNTKRGNFDFGLALSLDSKAGTWFIAPIFDEASLRGGCAENQNRLPLYDSYKCN